MGNLCIQAKRVQNDGHRVNKRANKCKPTVWLSVEIVWSKDDDNDDDNDELGNGFESMPIIFVDSFVHDDDGVRWR